MIMSYDCFVNKLNEKIKFTNDFYVKLLETIIDNPSRYCGLFRLSNSKTKLVQNVTQSIEIKFGYFMEDIITDYIELIGYKNKVKDLGFDENGDRLNADQLFVKGNTIYLVEQKIRDDHDSTKKRAQFANLIKKIKLIKRNNPMFHLVASIWFVDDCFAKNKNFYKEEIDKNCYQDIKIYLFYGKEFFKILENGEIVW